MGSFLSSSLVKAPNSYDLPESEEDDVDLELVTALHEVNQRFCYKMVQQRIRLRNEQAKSDEYIQNWNDAVDKLKEKYPHWTSDDFLNLRYQFKIFDSDGDQLLNYNEFNEALNLIQDSSSPEQRRAMFESVDTHQSNYINFEEYLQLMNNIKLRIPVPRPTKMEDGKVPAAGHNL